MKASDQHSLSAGVLHAVVKKLIWGGVGVCWNVNLFAEKTFHDFVIWAENFE